MEKRFPNHPYLRRLLLCSQGPLSTSRMQREFLGYEVALFTATSFPGSLFSFVAGRKYFSSAKGKQRRESLRTKLSLGFPSLTPCPNYGENALVYGRMIISTQSDPWKDHKFGLPHISVFNLFFQAFLTRSLDRFLIKFCLILQVFVIQIFSDIF